MRALFDRDDSTTPNRVAPGIGSVNNVFPGNLVTGTYTQVLSNSMVHEMTVGLSQNHWGFRVGTGALNASDYTSVLSVGDRLSTRHAFSPYGPYGDPHLGRSRPTSTRTCPT